MKKYIIISIVAAAALSVGMVIINSQEDGKISTQTPDPILVNKMANEVYEGEFDVINISQYPDPEAIANPDPWAVSTMQYIMPYISYKLQDTANPEFEFIITHNIPEFSPETWYTSTYKIEKMYETIAEVCEPWVATGDIEIENKTNIIVKNINLMNDIDEIILNIHKSAALYEIEYSSSGVFSEKDADNLIVEYYFEEFSNAELTLYHTYNLEAIELETIQ